MELTDTQVNELFENYWSGRGCACPGCGAKLGSKHSNVLGGYVIVFKCPKGCAVPSLESERDPKRGTFRDWTSEECAKLTRDYLASRAPVCPGCGVPVSGQSKYVFSGKLVELRCDRCRKKWEENVPR